MNVIHSTKNALKCLTKKNFLKQLEEMNEKLEKIQKDLNQFLDKTRKEF